MSEVVVPFTNMGDFLSKIIVFRRPKKMSYYALEWNPTTKKWITCSKDFSGTSYSKHKTSFYNSNNRYMCTLELINGTKIKVESELEFLLNDEGATLVNSNNSNGLYPILKLVKLSLLSNSWKNNEFAKNSNMVERPASINCARKLWMAPRTLPAPALALSPALSLSTLALSPAPVTAPVVPSLSLTPSPSIPAIPNFLSSLDDMVFAAANAAASVENARVAASAASANQQRLLTNLSNAGALRVEAARVAVRNRALSAPTNIEALPQRIAWLVAEAASNQNETCAISMETLSPITAAVTSCFHVFDSESIERWMLQNSTCPTCRKACKISKAFNE